MIVSILKLSYFKFPLICWDKREKKIAKQIEKRTRLVGFVILFGLRQQNTWPITSGWVFPSYGQK